MEKKYKRICPKCETEILYTQKYNAKRDEGLLCKSCCRVGIPFSNEHKRNLSICKTGTKQTMVTRLKNSATNKQRFLINPELKKKASETSKRILHLPHIRKKHVEALSKTRWLGKTFDKGQLEFIDKWNKLGFNFEPNYQLHTDDFLCYIDGYDRQKNVVLEYDGKYHNTIKQKRKDLIRQEKIVEALNPKKFWRYDAFNKQLKNVIGE